VGVAPLVLLCSSLEQERAVRQTITLEDLRWLSHVQNVAADSKVRRPLPTLKRWKLTAMGLISNSARGLILTSAGYRILEQQHRP
jgi:hypothetical protein